MHTSFEFSPSQGVSWVLLLQLQQEFAIIDEEQKKWVLQSLAKKYRDYKKDLKDKYYSPLPTDEERLQHTPPTSWPKIGHGLCDIGALRRCRIYPRKIKPTAIAKLLNILGEQRVLLVIETKRLELGLMGVILLERISSFELIHGRMGHPLMKNQQRLFQSLWRLMKHKREDLLTI